MKGLKDTVMWILTKKNLVIILFIVFLYLRLFISDSSLLLSSDSLKFIETSKRFPNYTLYNDEIYLHHPPLYPYTIRFFSLFFQDHTAAIFVSLISSIASFFVLYNFLMLLTKNFDIVFFVMVFYTMSATFIEAAGAILRETFVVLLILLALYYYVKGVKFNNKKSLIAATIFGSLLAITSDHVVFILPAFALSYIIFNKEKINLKAAEVQRTSRFAFSKRLKLPNLKYAIMPLLITLIVYGSWLGIKAFQYSNSYYYPIGIEGIPIDVRNFGIFELLSPQLFEDYSDARLVSSGIPAVKRVAFNIGYMFNMAPFSIPDGLNFTTMKYLLFTRHIIYIILIYVPLAMLAIFGLYTIAKEFIRTKKIYQNVNLYMIGIFLIFIFPITQKFVSPRYIYTSYIFLYFIMGYGLTTLLKKRGVAQIRPIIFPLIAILLLLLIPIWYYSHPYVVLFSKKVISSQKTGDFIANNIPSEAVIMAQPGYGVKLIYLTGNRVVGLHPQPEKLPELIDYYNISYIVFGRRYTSDAYYVSTKSVEFVRDNPDKFELIAAIQEDYRDFYNEEDPASTDEVYIYKIIN
ncbi:glycosyltransferase family 39 protein [Candidatus Woesearchaeota archaeon]|nr:glycosyltransferase family 39 protein [Candidatus Woesearchaeota archaeon]